jgi:iron complex transport system ATP-binding protein
MISSQPAVDLAQVGVLRADRWILRDITASIPTGACAAILGPNGCGKSTLMRVITGYVWPTQGSVRVLGETLGETDVAQLRRDIRLVQANGIVDPDPAAIAQDIVLTGFFGTAGLYDAVTPVMRQAALNELQRMGLASVAGHAFGTLSAGERMRCLIARALVVRPRLLLLDEPAAGLDLVGREQVLEAITTLNRDDQSLTILLTTHHLEELPVSTSQVLLMSNGQTIATGPPAKVLTDELLTRAYNWPIHVTKNEGRYFAIAQGTAIPPAIAPAGDKAMLPR